MRAAAVSSRILLIAPHGSYRTAPFLKAARRLDVEVLIASEGKHSLVSAYAQGLHINLADTEAALDAILQEAVLRPFAGIIGTDDASTELAAQASAALNLPHNPIKAVRLARRKDLARACLAEAGLAVPGHIRLDLTQPLAIQMETVRYPCVLKPLALSASRGVIRVDDPKAFVQACARIGVILSHIHDAEERRYVLAEDFIPGREVAVEGLLTAGRLTILAIFDKPDPLDGPFFEETYYITPSRLDTHTQQALSRSVNQACAAYRLREGPIHAECRINEYGVWILEVAARTIGGLCARLLQFGTGYDLEQLVLMHAMGARPAVNASNDAAGVLMIPIPRAGILRRVEGVMAAGRVPFIEEVVIYVREGYELIPLPEGSSYLGFIFARAPSPAQVEAALRAAHECLLIVVMPLWKAVSA